MLARRIDKKDGRDKYRALALYAADARLGKTQGEKTIHSWYAGGEADTYLDGIVEAEATQALNSRTREVKTYHLMVSFRPEDEARLTPKTFQEIEAILAEALGFSEHQRHCGVHANTDNLHLHVAYNMIHPRTLNRHAPYYDFPKLSQACRAIEQKYGLAVDKGIEPGRPKRDGLASAKVKSIEAQTGEESLFTYIVRHKPEFMAGVDAASNWREVHGVFLSYGLHLKASGNGLVIKDRFGKHHAKASQIDRALSKAKLTARFGDFEEAAPALCDSVKALERYAAAPLHLGPERSGLYTAFQEEMARRKKALEAIKEESARRYGAVKDHWRKKRHSLSRLPMLKGDRQRVLLELQKREQDEMREMRDEMAVRREAVRAEIPYTSWGKCLQHKAALGDEAALAILRSKEKIVQPEKEAPPLYLPASVEPREKWREKQRELLATPGVSRQHRQGLLAVLKMRELLEREALQGQASQEFTYSIDTKGTVLFKLASGNIRDTGREIHFSPHNEAGQYLAEKYAQAKWGPLATRIDESVFRRNFTDHAQSNKSNQAEKRFTPQR